MQVFIFLTIFRSLLLLLLFWVNGPFLPSGGVVMIPALLSCPPLLLSGASPIYFSFRAAPPHLGSNPSGCPDAAVTLLSHCAAGPAKASPSPRLSLSSVSVSFF